MKTLNFILHKANTRGTFNLEWLQTHHTFSFGSYYNPQRINFGALRVLNDDSIAPKKGFGMHPHDNMEIITIPLKGALTHKDSMQNKATIKTGDIQVMSAGTGILHSEYNEDPNALAELLQIWVIPNKRNVEPRYDQISLDINQRQNKLQQILSPNLNDEGVWIHQNAWFHFGVFDAKQFITYTIKNKENGIYLFVINGLIIVNEQELHKRDGLGIWNIDILSIETKDHSEFLLMEVPLKI